MGERVAAAEDDAVVVGASRRRLLIGAGLALFAALAALWLITLPGVPRLDSWLHVAALRHRSHASVAIARAVTRGGSTAVIWPMVALAALVFPRAGGRRRLLAAGVFAACVGAGIGVRLVVSLLVARPRPDVVDWAGPAGGSAFPSGHTTAATLGAGALAWSLARHTDRRAVRLAVWGAAAAYAAAVGWSRVWLGVHWPLDVAGGWLLGAGWLTATAWAVAKGRHGVAGLAPWAPAPAAHRPPARRTPMPGTPLPSLHGAGPGRRPLLPAPTAVKVPGITLAFWAVKVLTTGTGEAASDFLAARNLVVAAGLGLIGLVIGLVVQLRARRYVPWAYWTAVTMVAVFGTMAADAVHVVLGLSYWVTSAGYAAAVALVFAVWHRVEGTLDIHSVHTTRRELFYWAAVLVTFALGTAVGDLSAITIGLGFLPSAVLYAAMIAVPAIAWWRFRLNPVVAFWGAYVLTRPLGASIADWLGKPAERTGLGLGDGPVTVVATLLIVAMVVSLTVADRRTSRAPATSRPAPDPDAAAAVTTPRSQR